MLRPKTPNALVLKLERARRPKVRAAIFGRLSRAADGELRDDAERARHRAHAAERRRAKQTAPAPAVEEVRAPWVRLAHA
jgi:hypothetical protein